MKKTLALILIMVLTLFLISGCGAKEEEKKASSETYAFTDDAGREVELPKEITSVSPTGPVSTMILYTVAPEKLKTSGAKVGEAQEKYLGEALGKLPYTGQFYGGGATLNIEELINQNPQVIIDIGDKKKANVEDLDSISEQTGIPVIFIEGTMDTYEQMFLTLGEVLGEKEQGKKLSAYTKETLDFAKEKKESLTADQMLTVMDGTGETGLDVNAKGSIQATVLDTVGVENAIAVDQVNFKNGGNTISMEEVYNANPDIILVDQGGPYEQMSSDTTWLGLKAVQEGKYYEVPNGPYRFLSGPPSINQLIGIYWLGNLVYPQVYDYDIVEKMQEYYQLFLHYDLSEEEARSLLANSTYK